MAAPLPRRHRLKVQQGPPHQPLGFLVGAGFDEQQTEHERRPPLCLQGTHAPLQRHAAFGLGLVPAPQVVEDVGRIATQEGAIGRGQPTGSGILEAGVDDGQRLLAAGVEVEGRGAIGGDPHEVVEPAGRPGGVGALPEHGETSLQVAEIGGVHAKGAERMAPLSEGLLILGRRRDRRGDRRLGQARALLEAAGDHEVLGQRRLGTGTDATRLIGHDAQRLLHGVEGTIGLAARPLVAAQLGEHLPQGQPRGGVPAAPIDGGLADGAVLDGAPLQGHRATELAGRRGGSRGPRHQAGAFRGGHGLQAWLLQGQVVLRQHGLPRVDLDGRRGGPDGSVAGLVRTVRSRPVPGCDGRL